MTEKLIRDALGSPVPQLQNEDGTFTVLSNGDTTAVDFSKKKLLRDVLGSPLPMQYYDAELGRFVAGNLTGDSVDFIQIVSDLDAKLSGQLEEKANSADVGNKASLTTTNKTSLVAAVSEVNNKLNNQGIFNVATPASTVHVNDIKQNGSYRVTTTNITDVGLPSGTYIMEVLHSPISGLLIVQRFTLINTTSVGAVYMRVYNSALTSTTNNGWTKLYRMDNEGMGELSSLTTTAKTNIVASINEIVDNMTRQGLLKARSIDNTIYSHFNDMVEQGIYYMPKSNIPTGGPVGVTYPQLIVLGYSGYPVQIVQSTYKNELHIRSKASSGWNAWSKITTSAEVGELANLTTKTKTNLVSAISEIVNSLESQGTLVTKRLSNATHPSFNDIITQGVYLFPATGTMPTDGPPNLIYAHLIVFGHNLYPMQIVQHVYQNTMYVRSKISSSENKWTAWERLDTGGLSRLTTTNKTTVVDSINEINAKLTNIQMALVELAETGGL